MSGSIRIQNDTIHVRNHTDNTVIKSNTTGLFIIDPEHNTITTGVHSNGFLGVGTAEPEAVIHTIPTGSITNGNLENSGILIGDLNTPFAMGIDQNEIYQTGNDLYLGTLYNTDDSYGKIRFRTDNGSGLDDRMMISRNGNVSIYGNLTITGNLTADNFNGNGNGHGGGGSYEHPDTITLIDLTTTNNVTATNVSVSNELDVFSLSAHDITTQSIFVDTGNIGINVESPSFNLEVDGNTRIYGKFVNGNDYQGNSAYGATFDSGSRYYQFRTANERYLSIYNTGAAQNSVIQAASNGGANNRIALNPSGGNVGINKDYAGYNLDVDGNINYSGTITNVSDKRIKTNITNLNDNEALNMIRLLQPKKYQYIDTDNKTDKVVYGYIAQEVKDIIPFSVKQTTEAIPDIMTQYNCSSFINSNNINFIVHNTFSNVSVNDNLSVRFNTDNGTINQILQVSSIQDNITTFTVPTKQTHIDIVDTCETINSIFIYGRVVDDFHVMNKNSIFVVATAAIQELDMNVSSLIAENTQMKQSIEQLEQRLSIIENNH